MSPTAGELRRAAAIVAVLAVLGALLGLVWAAWSPPGPRALVVRPGVFIPDETEAFVAGDGRFAVLVGAVGLIAGLVAWRHRPTRGPATVGGLVVGGVAGAVLTALVGHLSGGGTFAGAADSVIAQLPLSLHMSGLLLLEAAAAVLVYGLLAAFAADDALGRPDPARELLVTQRALEASVAAGGQPQYRGGHGDAAGALQQRDLPPQQPPQAD